MTALHWAAQSGSVKSVKCLIKRGANVLAKDVNGRTPLILSTANTSADCLTILLRSLPMDSYVNDPDNEQMTALHWSAYNNSTDCVRALLKMKADVVLCDKEGKTPLHWTANNANPSTARTILEVSPSIVNLQDTDGRTALHHAVAADNLTIITTLLTTPGVHCNVSAIDYMFRTPLHWAAVLGYDQVLQYLLEAGANPSAGDGNNCLPLHYAVQRNNMECVVALVSVSDLNTVDREGRTATMMAAMFGYTDVLQLLLANNSDPLAYDKTGSTALHMAASAGYMECVQLLLATSSNLNGLNAEQHSPLFCACEQGHVDVVITLVQEGAAVDLQDKEGRTPLHWAASGGHSYICSVLVQNGCLVNQPDLTGRTSLHCACYGGHAECVGILLELGADGNAHDQEGVTALHWACTNGNIDAVRLLVDSGVYLSPMEGGGDRLTPLDYSIISEFQELAQYLIEKGAFSISGIQELAAVSIQKCYRGYRARKYVSKLKASQSKEKTPSQPPQQVTAEPSPPDRLGREEARVDRSGLLKEILKSTANDDSMSGKPVAVNMFKLGDGEKSDAARREKDRLLAYRKKCKAALVIQLAWRKYVQRKHQRRLEEKKKETKVFQVGSEEWRRELAALVIQLAWRQYLRRKLLRDRSKRQRIFHEWSPSVLAARQRMLVDRVYSHEMKTVQYFPPKPKQMVRPAYMSFIPSPAGKLVC
jgi:inversin